MICTSVIDEAKHALRMVVDGILVLLYGHPASLVIAGDYQSPITGGMGGRRW